MNRVPTVSHIPAAGVALALFAAALPTQPPVLLHLAVAGPAAWRTRLGPTNLGSMLASQPAEQLWRSYVAAIDASLHEVQGQGEAFAQQRARLLDYGGEVSVVAWLEQAEDALHLPRWSAALVATPDGHTDFAAMANELRGRLGRASDGMSTPSNDLHWTAPQIVAGRLLVVLASQQDQAAALLRAAAFVGEPLGPTAVARLLLEPGPALGLLRDRSSDRDFVAALLGDATRRLTLQLGSAGPHLAVDLSASFRAGAADRGLLAGLYSPTAGPPALEWLVAEDAATHFAWRLDLPALWPAWLRAQAALADREVTAIRELLRARFGVDFDKDVLRHLAGEALLCWRPDDPDETDDPGFFANTCLVVPVRDEEALAAAAAVLLPRLGGRCEHDEDGVLRGKFWDFELALGHGFLCAATGAHAEQQLFDVLERARQRPAAPRTPSLPPGAPVPCNGVGRLSVTTLIARDLYGQLRWWLFLLGWTNQLGHVARVAKEAQRWLPLLDRYELTSATTATGTTADAWQLRILW